ncbi:MAG: PAS domain S-box protein [Rhodoferax sp.]|nr:PAS domain S-box protein [Rhodoferax sp.]
MTWYEFALALIGLLLCGMTWALVNAKQRASRLATQLTSVTDTLRQQEGRYHATFENAPIGIAQVDPATGRFLRVNHGFCQLVGYNRSELEAMTFMTITHPDDVRIGHAEMRNLAEGSIEHFALEKRYIHKSGKTLWCALSVSAMREAENGQVSNIAVLRDETECHQVQITLHACEERLRSFVENTNDTIFTLTSEGICTYIAPVAANHLGYAPDALLGTSLAQLLHTQDVDLFQDFLQRVLASSVKQDAIEYRIRHLDGSWRWHATTGTALRNADTDTDALAPLFLGIARDITDMREIRQALERAVHAAEAANLAKSHFLATTSHEIRTPMNSILGLAQLLMSASISNAQRQDYARTILHSGQGLLNLLNDILDLSKVEAGKLVLESVAFDPAHVLRTVETQFMEAAQKKNLTLEAHWLGNTNDWFMGDPHRLQQMLANLVSNSLRFTEHGTVRIEACEISRKNGVAVLEFSVSDSGTGIAADKLELLYQPFSQIGRSDPHQLGGLGGLGGTGLGLSIVHSLAYLMGGEVGVESQLGQGSRFWFKIRAGFALKDEITLLREDAAPPPSLEPTVNVPNNLSGRILVVEDNPINRKVVSKILASMGLAVLEVENGQQGLDAVVRGEPIDLVLMDIQMPIMDGYTATRRIRQWEQENSRPHLPIIALTANAFEEDRHLCLAAGMDDFSAKPINMGALCAQLMRWLPTQEEQEEQQENPLPQ